MMTECLAAHRDHTSEEPARSPGNPPYRVLVVDDEPMIRTLNTDALQRSGYDANSADDGAAAWAALNVGTYHLMITDNNMPKVTGVELLRKLHAARMTLPVIMATGIMPEQDFARSPWLRPAAILLKPYSLVELLETVAMVLGATEWPVARPNWQVRPSPEPWRS